MVMQAFDSSRENFTTFPDTKSAVEFYETWKAPEEVKDKARSYIRRDKNNLTVWFVDFGHWELHELLRSNGTKQDLYTYIDQTLYRIRNGCNIHDRSEKQEHNPSFALVVNMDGYGVSQAFDLTTTAYLQELAKRHMSALQTLDYAVVISSAGTDFGSVGTICQNLQNEVGTINALVPTGFKGGGDMSPLSYTVPTLLVVINMPSWARFLTGIMKPFLGNVLDRFEIFGYEDWLPALLERIDAQELPRGYGAYVGDGDGSDDNDNEGDTGWFS